MRRSAGAAWDSAASCQMGADRMKLETLKDIGRRHALKTLAGAEVGGMALRRLAQPLRPVLTDTTTPAATMTATDSIFVRGAIHLPELISQSLGRRFEAAVLMPRPERRFVSGHREFVRWPRCPPRGGVYNLRLGPELQLLQQPLPLFANLINSSADLNRNGVLNSGSNSR